MTKKCILLLVLLMALTLTACNRAAADGAQSTTAPATTEAPAPAEEPTATEAPEDTAPAPTSATEAEPQPTQTAQQSKPPAEDEDHGYLSSLEAEAARLRAALEQEAMTQTDMNAISQELYELWDNALNDLWSKLENTMPQAQFEQLLEEQLDWIEAKEAAVTAAGSAAEGGSMAQLLMNLEAADWTEARVCELYGLLK